MKHAQTFGPLPYPQTRESAAAWFAEHGVTRRAWADALGLRYRSVIDALYGKTLGTRGDAHYAAIALGLKPNPEEKNDRSKIASTQPLGAGPEHLDSAKEV